MGESVGGGRQDRRGDLDECGENRRRPSAYPVGQSGPQDGKDGHNRRDRKNRSGQSGAQQCLRVSKRGVEVSEGQLVAATAQVDLDLILRLTIAPEDRQHHEFS